MIIIYKEYNIRITDSQLGCFLMLWVQMTNLVSQDELGVLDSGFRWVRKLIEVHLNFKELIQVEVQA